jgi:DNA-directed RNA polymerase sigma subunit (sigma70/sigma32)
MKNQLLKRNKEIQQMRNDRYKLREIAEKYNISKERIRQITSKENANS